MYTLKKRNTSWSLGQVRARNQFLEGDDDAAAKAAADAADAAAAKAAADAEKKFTQKDLDDQIKKRLGRDKADREKLVADLTKLQQSASLSEQEKQDLANQIDGLNSSMRTAKEQAEHEKKQLENRLKSETENLSKDRDTWKNRFMDSTIKRSITDAAVSAGGDIPEQFVMMFSNSTRLEEEKGEDSKATGNFIPKIKFQALDSDSKVINFDLPVTEAFSKMRELGMHKNLFKHGATPGTGADGKGTGGNGKPANQIPERKDFKTDQAYSEAYQGFRDKYNLDGTEIKKG